MKLALFDFDGTITHRDSLFHFIRYAHGEFFFLLGLVICSPVLLAYLLGFLSKQKTKEFLYRYYFKNWSLEKFQTLCVAYAQQALPQIIRTKALEKIHWHKIQGHRIIIVSASIENYLLPWCKMLELELLATQLLFSTDNSFSDMSQVTQERQTFSGRFKSPNCTGIEKVKRIKAVLNLAGYEYIYAYGDSLGDREMLALAHENHLKPFR